MASGKPDYYNSSAIHGLYAGTMVTIAVDADGNMLGILQGEHAGALKKIALDAGGRIITVLRDPANDRYLAVDADGNLTSVMKGDFAGVLKTIAVDANGVMLANLSVQDLPAIKISTTPGDMKSDLLVHGFVASGSYDIVDVAGAGTVIGGYLTHDTGVSHKTCGGSLVIDGTLLHVPSFQELNDHDIKQSGMGIYTCLYYDDVNFSYAMGFLGGYGFNTSLKLRLFERVGAGGFEGILIYSLKT